MVEIMIAVAQTEGKWDATTAYTFLIQNDFKGADLSRAIKELKEGGAI